MGHERVTNAADGSEDRVTSGEDTGIPTSYDDWKILSGSTVPTCSTDRIRSVLPDLVRNSEHCTLSSSGVTWRVGTLFGQIPDLGLVQQVARRRYRA